MSKDFSFSAIDFLVGTKSMTDEEVGRYIRILSTMAIDGRMKEEKIVADFGEITDRIRPKFKIDQKNFWYNVRLEKELKKSVKQPMTEEESADYKECLDVYYKWFEHETHNPPLMKVYDFTALKQMIVYFRGVIKRKGLDATPADSFKLIFQNWKKLDSVMQSQTNLSQIYKNLNNILNQLRNGGIQRKQSRIDGYREAHTRLMQDVHNRRAGGNETI